MTIRCYVVTHDYGFAPNYSQPALTLACCKPNVRRTAVVGDWIVGTHSVTRGSWRSLCYAAKVTELTDFDSYYRRPEFVSKRPRADNSGDAIYYRNDLGLYEQVRNRHHNNANKDTDLKTDRVLICREGWHFPNGTDLPIGLAERIVKKGPGHRNCSDASVIKEFEAFLCGLSTYRVPRTADAHATGSDDRMNCRSEPRKRQSQRVGTGCSPR